VLGGWITETYSWHWLFLINVAPGVIAAAATPFLLPRARTCFARLATLDGYSLALMAISLASLEIGLKQAPHDGWFSLLCSILFLLSAATAIGFAARTLKAAHPVIELSTLRIRPFAIGCALSFCLGVGLFGSVYLMPVFFSYFRHHYAFEFGTIMLVTGVSQLVTAPIAGALESRLDPRLLSAAGFALFALGLGCSAMQSRVADFDEMFWPQVLRGVAIMFCLLPPTRLALGALTEAEVPDASGLFNLMRNLGGAIGIALIDTILYGRTGGHAEALRDRLIAGDITAARAIGLDLNLFRHRPPGASDATVETYLRPMVEKAAFAISTNEAWALLAIAALLGLLLVPFAGQPPRNSDADVRKD
jgi:DHA2 family multidrug resistance protein